MSELECSDESETYSSEGDFAVSNACESLSSSEELDADVEGILSKCPPQELLGSEYDELCNAEKINGKLFPNDVAMYVKEHFKDIYRSIESVLSSDNDAVLYVAFSLAKLLQPSDDYISCIPKTGSIDVCIFSPSKPVRILTFMLNSHEKTFLKYNAELSRYIMISVNNELMSNFTFINGVIDKEAYTSGKIFEQRIKQLDESARAVSIPVSLHMTSSKCRKVITSFLKVLGPKAYTEFEEEGQMESLEDSAQCPHQYDGRVCPYKEKLDELMKAREDKKSEEVPVKLSKPVRKLHHSVSVPEMPVYRRDASFKSKDTLLHKACHDGKLVNLKSILSNTKANINSMGKHGRTPVMVAAKRGFKEGFDRLVETGCDLADLDDMGQTILHLACLGGNADIVRDLISRQCCGIEDVDQLGQNALAKAALRGDKDIFDLLVQEGSTLAAVDYRGNNLLHFACQANTNAKELVSDILSRSDIDINSKGEDGLTSLMIASRAGDIELVDILISSGARLTDVDDHENNVLHIACLWNNNHVAEYLLSRDKFDIDVNDKGKNGRTSLHIAAANGNRKLLELLVSTDADIQLKDDDNNNVLHIACMGHLTDIVHYLLFDLQFDVDCTGQCGKTPVMLTAIKGFSDLCETLVEHGCNMLVTDIEMNTVLHFAVLSGNRCTVEYILSKAVTDINNRGENGRTPIMMAANQGYKGVFDLLLRQGCEIGVTDDNGYTILHLACIGNKLDMVKHLIQQNIVGINKKDGTSQTPVMLSAKLGQRKMFELLIESRCSITDLDVDDDGNNVLHAACAGGSVDIVDYLVSRNIVDINSRGENGKTPILVAASKGHRGVFDLLLEKGCTIDEVDDDGNNILHLACLGGHAQFVRYLVYKEFLHIDSKGNMGSTPVIQAARKGDRKIVETLVNQECDLTIVDQNGDNALHWACIAGKVHIVEYLLKHGVPDRNGTNHCGESPAELAYKHGRDKVLDLLMNDGCDID